MLGPVLAFAALVFVAARAAAAAAATADAVGLSTAAELDALRVGDKDDGFDGGEPPNPPPPVGDRGYPVDDPGTASSEAWCWGNRCSDDEGAEPEADAASPPPPPPLRWRGLVFALPPCSDIRDIMSEALPAVEPPTLPPPARVPDEAAADEDGDSACVSEGCCLLLEGDATLKRSIGSIE